MIRNKDNIIERFEILEQCGPLTITELSYLSVTDKTALRTWLSRMTNFVGADLVLHHYLIHEYVDNSKSRIDSHTRRRRRAEGSYRVNPEENWRERFMHDKKSSTTS